MKRLVILLALLLASPAAFSAVAYVGKGTKGEANGTSITPGLPSASEGDLEFLVVMHSTGSINNISGWNCLTEYAGPDQNIRFCHRFRPASASAPTVTATASQSMLGVIYAFSGVNGTPIDNSFACSQDGSGTNATMLAPTLTTVTTNAMLFRVFVSTNADSVTHNTHSEGTLTGVDGTILGNDNQLSSTYVVQASATASGTASAVTTAPSGSRDWAACTIAFRAATAAVTATFDADAYDLGDTVTVTLNNYASGTPTAVTELAGGDTFTAAGNTTTVTFDLCDLADLVAAGACNNTQLETVLTLSVGNGTEIASDTLTINCPSGMQCGQINCDRQDCPRDAQDLIPAGTLDTDDYLCRLISGTGFAVSDSLVPAGLGTDDTIGCRTYDGTWTTEVQKSLTLPSGSATTEDSTVVELEDCGDGTFKPVGTC